MWPAKLYEPSLRLNGESFRRIVPPKPEIQKRSLIICSGGLLVAIAMLAVNWNSFVIGLIDSPTAILPPFVCIAIGFPIFYQSMVSEIGKLSKEQITVGQRQLYIQNAGRITTISWDEIASAEYVADDSGKVLYVDLYSPSGAHVRALGFENLETVLSRIQEFSPQVILVQKSKHPLLKKIDSHPVLLFYTVALVLGLLLGLGIRLVDALGWFPVGLS